MDNPVVDSHVEVLRNNPQYKEAIKLLREVWDEHQPKMSDLDDQTSLNVWLTWTDYFFDDVRGEM